MNRTFVWGHRGAGFRDVENSMSSFKKAIDMGVDGIKTEAQLSQDGEIFLCFQESLRKDEEYLPIKDLDSTEIRTLRLDNNESVLTLPEFFSKKYLLKDLRRFDIFSSHGNRGGKALCHLFGKTGPGKNADSDIFFGR